MNLTIIKDVILWLGWIFIIGGTIYILFRGQALLKMVKGSLIGRLAEGLMVGFFIEMYSVLILCTVLLLASEQNVYIVLPFFLLWLFVFIRSWRVMRKTRQSVESMFAEK